MISDAELSSIQSDLHNLQNGALIGRLLDDIDTLNARIKAQEELHYKLRANVEDARKAAIQETAKIGRELGQTQARLDAYERKYGRAL